MLGLTAECAQCHDHKYDPISQKEYYQLFAFFNNTKEEGFEGDVSTSKPAKSPILIITDAESKSLLTIKNYKNLEILEALFYLMQYHMVNNQKPFLICS